MKYYIVTFGCQMNEHDSGMIAGILDSNGYIQAANIEDTDLLIINSCCVRESAEHKIRSYIGSLKPYYIANKSFTVIVCGCMVQKSKAAQALARLGEYVGILIGTSAIGNLPAHINEYLQTGERIIDIKEDDNEADPTYINKSFVKYSNPYKAEISIIYGCNNFCSYCIVPYVRGRERSCLQEDIIAEVNLLAEKGYKEILLLGQNVNSYGKDLADKRTFAGLLQECCRVEGIKRIRYMSSHPRDITDALLDVIADNNKICKHYHLPLQSGCDRLLKLMNRGYNCVDYYEIIRKIRARVPNAVITTDLIVGFPGETDEDFAETLAFVEKCRFDAAYTFLYSPRSGTVAADMPEQLSMEIKKARLNQLMDLQNPISLEINQKMVGFECDILCEGNSHNNDGMQFGRTEGNKIVIFEPPYDECGKAIDLSGQIRKIRINRANTWNFYGELL